MDERPDDSTEQERLARIDEIVTDAVERLRRGEPVDVPALLESHAELEPELGIALSGVRRLERTADEQLRRSLEDEVPHAIGPYRVVRELGRGAMGIVYEAWDTTLDRRVAVKLLSRSASTSSSYVERFHREAHAAARLEHENVVPIYGVGESGGRRYIVMKLVDGHRIDQLVDASRAITDAESSTGEVVDARLSELVKRLSTEEAPTRESSADDRPSGNGRAPATKERVDRPERILGREYHRSVARIGLECARALAYAHQRGVLHRDIKPGNLLIDERGHTWVADFGLAKLDETDDLTREGDFVGTLRYTSPEQFEGAAEARSDVYALGLVLYELATLRSSTRGRTRSEVVHEVLYVQPREPHRVRAEVPLDLSKIVMKSIAKLPEQRYASADDMAADLAAFLEGRPIAAHAPSALYLARLAIDRNRGAVGAIALLAVLLVAGAVAHGIQLRRSAAIEEALAYRANLTAASASILAADTVTAMDRLDDCPPTLRGWEWDHLRASVDQSVSTLLACDEPVHGVDFVDGRLMVSHRRGLAWLDGDSREETIVPGSTLEHASIVSAVPFEDRWISFHVLEGLWSVPRSAAIDGGLPDAATCAEVGIRRSPIRASTGIVELRAGAPFAAFTTSHGALHVVDVRTMEPVLQEPHGMEGVCNIAGDAGMSRVVLVARDGACTEWDLTTFQRRTLLRSHCELESVAYSTDASRVAIGTSDRSVLIVDTETGRVLHQLVGHGDIVQAMAFSPDDRLLATAGRDHEIRLWDAATGGRLQTLRGHSGTIFALAFHPDGQHVVSGDAAGVVKEWLIGASGGRSELHGHHADVVGLSFARSGDRFATGGREATIRVVDTASLRLDLLLLGHVGELTGVEWYGGDRRLCSTDRAGRLVDWNLELAEPRWTRDLGRVLTAPCLAADESCLYVATFDGAVLRIDPDDGRTLARRERLAVGAVEGDPGPGARVLAFDATRRQLIAGAADGALYVLDPHTLELRDRFPRHDGAVAAIVYSPDDRTMVTVSTDRALVFSASDGTGIRRRTQLGSTGGSDYTFALEDACYSPGGRLLAIPSRDQLVRLVDARTGTPLLDLKGHVDWVRRAAFSPDGRTLVTTGSSSSVRVWDVWTSSERDAARAARMALEDAGRALVHELVGTSEPTIADLDRGMRRIAGSTNAHVELARAARAVIQQERSRRLLSVFERRVAESWSSEDTRRARAWLYAFERGNPFDAAAYRLQALVACVDGRFDEAARDAAALRRVLGDGIRSSALALALEARIAQARGESDVAAARRSEALRAIESGVGDQDERETARYVLDRG